MSLSKPIQEGDLQTFQQLLASGADVNTKDHYDETPLHVAAKNTGEHAVKMVELLLAHGADVNLKDDIGETPLHVAAKNTSEHAVKMAEVLLALGADVNVKNAFWGSTPLHLAAKNTSEHAVKMAELLLAQGADVAAKLSYCHMTPLHNAANNTSEHAVKMVEILLAQGADVHVKNNTGETALDIAREKGHPAVVSLLTPWTVTLAELASEGDTVALGRKLDTGADVNELCPDGRTALHHAVRSDHVAAARLLLHRGADPLRADGNGRRPYDVAGPACKEVLVTLAVEALEDVEEVEGVCGLKETLLGIVQQVQVRRSEGRDTAGVLHHCLFYGSARTGKTTGARMLARVLHAFGLLSKNHVEETSAQGLTGEYVGQSKTRVEEAMKAARGGVLFVDEAYMLGGDPYGDEAMAKLLSMMTEDGYRHSTVVVMAGSRDRMRGLLQRNEGLQSRFTETVHFPDWSPAQCTRFVQKLADEAKPPRVFEPACKETAHASLDECFAQLRQQPGWANARDAQLMFDDVVRQRDRRLAVAPGSPPGITADDTAKACNRFLARRGAHLRGSGTVEVQTPQQHFQNTMQESTESLNCYLAEGLQDSKGS